MRWTFALAGWLLLAGTGGTSACEPARITFLTEPDTVSFALELAITPAEQQRGLMFRPDLAPDRGMLFLYDPPQRASFWMKNTMLPLDMIFIDDTGTVESIAAQTVPYSLAVQRSDNAVRGVLEIRGGRAAEVGIVPGIRARHPAFAEAPADTACPG